MRSHFAHVALALAVSSGFVVGACGGGAEGPGPQAPGTATAPTSPATGPTATATAPTGTTTAMTPPPSAAPMKNVVASQMAADLKEIGLDAKNLPPLAKMEPEKLRKVMKTFTKALGVQCNACHDPNDFRAWTPHKRVASGMWNELVRRLSMEDGSLLYCDSCHQGSMEILDRKDKKALSAWMDANFVSKLKRRDGKEHSCDTCHGDPFEPKFLATWTKEKPKK